MGRVPVLLWRPVCVAGWLWVVVSCVDQGRRERDRHLGRRARGLVGCRLPVATLILISAGLVSCGEGEGTPESTASPACTALSGVPLDRIAFVPPSGDLYTVGPAGGAPRQGAGEIQAAITSSGAVLAQPLDGAGYFTWPTWSPDGSTIVDSIGKVFHGQVQLSIVIIDTKPTRATTAFEIDTLGMVAGGLPH